MLLVPESIKSMNIIDIAMHIVTEVYLSFSYLGNFADFS